jgi:hypothetical protein
MINYITSTSPSIMVSCPSPSGPHISPGAQGAGMIRWNSNMNQMEVNDGNIWMPLIQGSATVALTPEVESLLSWAREQQVRQQHREQLARDNPALHKAMEAIARAEADFDLLAKFVDPHA